MVYFVLHRATGSPFTDKQIKLVENFADQASSPSRMHGCSKRSSSERANSLSPLEQQTATLDVLQVIISVPGDLQPAFSGDAEKAVRLCDAKFGNLLSLGRRLLTSCCSP